MKPQCLQVAAGYPNTGADATATRTNVNNDLGCREYHAQAARADNNTHCAHAGPSGGGVACGTRAQAWGTILAAAPCLDTHVNVLFRTGLGDAKVDALIPPVGAGATGSYSVTFDTTGNTQACRIYHLGVASTAPAAHCSHGFVSGGGACGDIVGNLCAFIGGICGFGNNATYQYLNSAACLAANANSTTAAIATGVPGTAGAADDSYECRFYHAMVAGSYLTGGSNGAVSGAASQMQYHCGHTLRPSNPMGCGVTTSAPTPKTSGASGPVLSAAVIISLFAL